MHTIYCSLQTGVQNAAKEFAKYRQEAALKHNAEESKEERETRERFVAALSHDLRTPLTAVKTLAQLVLRYPERHESHPKMMVRIIDNVDRADRMIQDLLDANRVRAGERIPLQLDHCDLAAVLRQTLDEQTLIHGDRFLVNVSGNSEGFWSADALRRVMENLISNAVKYGEPNGPITISLAPVKNGIELRVHNEGGELTEAEQKEVFEYYRRTGSATRSETKGWGIGLTLVRGIVEAHGGTAELRSKSGGGTTAIIFLPWDARAKS